MKIYISLKWIEKKILETAKLLKKIEIEEDDNPCEGCRCRDCCEAEEEFNYEDLLDIFVEKILEIGPCPICLRNLLDEFADIFIGDEDDFEEDECDCEECCEELVDCIEPALNIYINTGDINISSDFDVVSFIEQLKKFGVGLN